jgi:hypothetical protein
VKQFYYKQVKQFYYQQVKQFYLRGGRNGADLSNFGNEWSKSSCEHNCTLVDKVFPTRYILTMLILLHMYSEKEQVN